VAGALDSDSELTLMHSAGTADAARKDLTALGADAARKTAGILIVDVFDLISAEHANFAALVSHIVRTSRSRRIISLVIHFIKRFLS
jgi:hypothetical protein